MRRNKSRFDSLTGLRAIAAMMIFCFHFRKYWFSSLPLFIYKALNEFHIGVAIFFVLSGFLIAHTYKDVPLQSKTEYLKYILIRFVRIFPVYLFILASKYIDKGFPPIKETLLNFTLFKGFYDNYNLTGITQSWSLTVELTFYCFAPLIFAMAKRKIVRPLIYILPMLLIIYLMGVWLHSLGYNRDSFLYDFKFVLDATFFGRFFEFYMGILLALFIARKEKIVEYHKGTRFTLIGIAGVIVSCFIISFFAKDIFSPGTGNVGGILIRNLLLPIFIAVLLYGLITEINWLQRILGSWLFILLGNASYIFYLLHISYGYGALAKIRIFYDYNFTFMWLVSIAGYFLFEKPIYNFAKGKISALFLARSKDPDRLLPQSTT